MTDTPKHSVSVAGIVVNDRGQVLVIRRSDNGHWEPPGGVLEVDESFEDGVRREVAEETGFRVSVDRLTGVYKNMNRAVVALVFRCSPLDDHQHATDNEATSVRWIEPADAVDMMDPAYAVRVTDAFRQGPARTRSHNGVELLNTLARWREVVTMSRTDEFESQDDDDDAVDSPEVVTQDIERGARFGSSLAGASLTQLLLVLGADPAVAAIAGAGTTPVVANAFDAIVRRRRERLVIASTEACRQGNCTFDDIIAAAIDSDRKIEMLASALNAAAASDDERKVRALGIALANGVLQTDQARIDESAVILRTIARLDAPDVRLLHHMAESTQTGFVVRTSRSVDQGTLVSNLPHLAPVIDALVAKLSGLGIITDESFGISSNTVWHVTSLGRQCLAAIAAHGAQPE